MDEEGRRGVKVFQAVMAKANASGETAKSAYHKVEGKGPKTTLEILAREFTDVLWRGSRKAKTTKPPREMVDKLKIYARFRGIPEDKAYAMAVKLLKEGQKPGKHPEIPKAMDDFSDEVADKVTSEFAGYAVNQIIKAFR